MKAKFYIYRNLHTDTFSVKFRGKVIRHPKKCFLINVDLNVSEKGRERVLRERVKNVHAMLAAKQIKRIPQNLNMDNYEEFFYDPYKYNTFVNSKLEPIFNLKQVLCLNNKIYKKKA